MRAAACCAVSCRRRPTTRWRSASASARCWWRSTRPRRHRSSRRLQEQQQLRTQKLGEILLTKQIVSAEDLELAIIEQARMPMVRIGEALIALGFINNAQLEDGAVAAARGPQRAAGRTAGAPRPGVARRPADRAGAQDGLPAGRRDAVRARGRGAGAAALCGGQPAAGAAAAAARRPADRGGGRPVAPGGAGRHRVRLADQGGAGAGARQPAARGHRQGLRAHRRQRRPGRAKPRHRREFDAEEAGKLLATLEQQQARDSGERDEQSDRAVRQLAGAADQLDDRRGAERRACPTSTSNASPGARRCASASARTARCARTWSCRTPTAAR